jgi:hypothetical protein
MIATAAAVRAPAGVQMRAAAGTATPKVIRALQNAAGKSAPRRAVVRLHVRAMTMTTVADAAVLPAAARPAAAATKATADGLATRAAMPKQHGAVGRTAISTKNIPEAPLPGLFSFLEEVLK